MCSLTSININSGNNLVTNCGSSLLGDASCSVSCDTTRDWIEIDSKLEKHSTRKQTLNTYTRAQTQTRTTPHTPH